MPLALGRCLAAPALAFCCLVPGHAEDPDVLFQKARSLPKERREEARELCRKALEGHPDYDDVRIHLAKLYTWDDRYDEARKELRYILERRPGNEDAREAFLDVEVWSDHPHEALRLCDEGLALKGSAQLLYRKAKILKSLGDVPGAYKAAQAALVLDPNHQPARLLRDDLDELLQRSKVSFGYSHETYSAVFTPWQMETVTLGHRFDQGTVLGRVNRASRFGAWGTQVEVDAYPRIVEGTYAYLNVGKSSDFLFPTTSCGAQLYHNFKGGWEGSLGFRYMDFTGSVVNIYVGTLGKYLGDAFYNLQLNVIPSAVGSSLSGSLSARWYLGDVDSYVNVSAGSGYSPDYIAWSAAVVNMRSSNVSVGGQKRLPKAWILSGGVAYEHQEYLPATFRAHWTYSAGVEKRF